MKIASIVRRRYGMVTTVMILQRPRYPPWHSPLTEMCHCGETDMMRHQKEVYTAQTRFIAKIVTAVTLFKTCYTVSNEGRGYDY